MTAKGGTDHEARRLSSGDLSDRSLKARGMALRKPLLEPRKPGIPGNGQTGLVYGKFCFQSGRLDRSLKACLTSGRTFA